MFPMQKDWAYCRQMPEEQMFQRAGPAAISNSIDRSGFSQAEVLRTEAERKVGIRRSASTLASMDADTDPERSDLKGSQTKSPPSDEDELLWTRGLWGLDPS